MYLGSPWSTFVLPLSSRRVFILTRKLWLHDTLYSKSVGDRPVLQENRCERKGSGIPEQTLEFFYLNESIQGDINRKVFILMTRVCAWKTLSMFFRLMLQTACNYSKSQRSYCRESDYVM